MSETRFILHHYEQSPYAEKIRLMMGLADQAWGSVLSPPFPPRPNVDPLAGGYRRIPIAQLGADVFCDTVLIAREVAGLTGMTELAPDIAMPEAAEFARRAEGQIFFAAITALPPAKLLAQLPRSLGPVGALRFVKDRMGMMGRANIKPPGGAEARALLEAFVTDLDEWLANRDSVDQVLGYADFCAYHPLWLARSLGSGGAIEGLDALARWMERMEGLGHGKRVELTAEDAFTDASASEPRALPRKRVAHDLEGEPVTVAPADYGTVPVEGVLAAVTTERLVIERETDRFGTVHVHFPRTGYQLDAA